METLIEFQNVCKYYHMGDTTVVAADHISFRIYKGEFVAIVGSSGSGKSTAMNIIGCLDVPTSGTYHLGGIDVSTMEDDQQAEIRNKMLGFIFQQYNLIPKLTVEENVELLSLQGWFGSPEHQAAADWQDFLNHYDDGGALDAIGNGDTGLSDRYLPYGVWTQEMAETLDTIAGSIRLSPIA